MCVWVYIYICVCVCCTRVFIWQMGLNSLRTPQSGRDLLSTRSQTLCSTLPLLLHCCSVQPSHTHTHLSFTFTLFTLNLNTVMPTFMILLIGVKTCLQLKRSFYDGENLLEQDPWTHSLSCYAKLPNFLWSHPALPCYRAKWKRFPSKWLAPTVQRKQSFVP